MLVVIMSLTSSEVTGLSWNMLSPSISKPGAKGMVGHGKSNF